MNQKTNISLHPNFSEGAAATPKEVMVDVENVSMVFNIANQQLNSLKEFAIALTRRELMFKEFRALDKVSFKVDKGDVYGILGTNGSGKSTLLKIISGVLDPTEGNVSVHGRIAPLIELGAGFDPELTARENIYLNGALLGYSKSFISENIEQIISFAEIGDFVDMPIKNYSSGMVARIAFAIATVIVPDILIVDEVLSVGDFLFRQKCEKRIRELISEHGTTVLIVSHSEQQIKSLCNKAVWIEEGEVRRIGSAYDVCRAYQTLGGRARSQEAEEFLLHAISLPYDIDKADVEVISEDDRYALPVALARQIYGGSVVDAVVVAPGVQFDTRVLALALANALDSPLLLSASDTLPDATMEYLSETKPRTVVVLNHLEPETKLTSSTIDSIASIGHSEVVNLEGDTFGDLSLAVLEFGLANNAWGDAAIIGTYQQCVEMGTMLPFIAHRKPFVLLSDNAAQRDQIVRIAKEQKEFEPFFAQISKETVACDTELDYHCCENYLTLERMGVGDAGAVFSSSNNLSHFFTSIQYAIANGEWACLFECRDPNRKANCLRAIGKWGKPGRQASVIGGNQEFDSVNIELVHKAARGEYGIC